MSRSTLALTDELREYILDVSLREHPLLAELREETARHPEAKMQISPDQGQFMATLLRLMQARSVLEIGTFTGYSTLAMMLALPSDGHIVACDISEDYTKVARRYWSEAGVADRITLHIAPASQTLHELLASGKANTFDAAFIDADKESYDVYFEKSLPLVRPGGLIMIDNVLRGGDAANPATESASTQSIQTLNKKLHQDSRVHLTLVPIGDGMTLLQKI
ncbi:MAG: class I SAM-dependent methyltransferase [Bacteroidetes bacterium]|nr:class I SAM-dependent methyltransferase [Bacteroidota bacterium]